MTFGAPYWFWAMALLPLFCVLFAWNERRSRALLQKMVALRLEPGLAGNVSRGGRLARFLALLLGLAFVIATLAEPRRGFTIDKTPAKGRDVMIAIDTSKSMLSTDIEPNRLTRAKLAAEDLLHLLPGDRTGLIAFAGDAFLEAPLTIDYGAVLDSIHDLDTNTIPLGGTNIAEAIRQAADVFGKGESQNDCLVLFTDGEELDGDAIAAAREQAGKFRIFTVGLGTKEGSIIPIPTNNGGTDFVKDENGEVVHSHLDEARLGQIAEITGGFYTHLENGPADMKRIVEDGLGRLKEHEFDEEISKRPIERYQWPLGAGLLLICGSLLVRERKRQPDPKRKTSAARPVTAAAAVCLLLLPRAAYLANHGIELYQEKDFKDALQDFQQQGQRNPDSDALQFDQGTASYQLGDYENAISAFGKALTTTDPALREKSEYNLANSLFQRAAPEERPKESRIADLRNAIQHYTEAIKADPKDKDAVFNKEVAERKLRELQKPPPSPTPQDQNKKQQNQQQQQQQQNQQNQQDKNQQNNKSGSDKDQNQSQNSGGQKGNDQKDQQKSAQNKDQQNKDQNSGSKQGQDQQSNNQSPQDKSNPQNGDQANQQPTPSEGNGQPKDENKQNQGNTAGNPTPAPGQDKKLSGDIKEAQGRPSPSPGEQQETEAVAAASPGKPGDMTPSQALSLLESLRNEDARYPLNEQKNPPAVLKDW